MSSRDGAERLLTLGTTGLPAHRAEWGTAMRAELAAIDDPGARRRFARSASFAAFRQGFVIRIGFGLITGVLVAAVALMASRLQLADGAPGLLEVTVPVPAFLLLLAALLSAGLTRSFRIGLETGAVAFIASSIALFTVLATEGLIWMDRHGVFLLDGDPPRGPIDTSAVVFNIFSTGMWVGHLIVWWPALLIGAALGAWIGGRRSPAVVAGSSA
ncbi:hypothetical protein [Microcella pacifica]|uniref:Uncharacterized protein n=1 Tax=Microcella pacifica TaxID=2591847 RepID=A0A9E5JKC1_9MICO|nr:hypothetical protein [Microcella pacifica]NHF61844.1 hypothetical protein [Microcella pacifica]